MIRLFPHAWRPDDRPFFIPAGNVYPCRLESNGIKCRANNASDFANAGEIERATRNIHEAFEI